MEPLITQALTRYPCKAMLEIRKEARFLKVINKPIIYKYYYNMVAVFCSWTFSNKGTKEKTFQRPADTSWRVQLVCVNVHAHISSEQSLEYDQD